MIRQLILKTAFNLKRPGLIHLFNDFEKSQWQPYEVLRNEQEQQLKKLIAFVYSEVPYYTKLFNQHGLKPDDVIAIKDLEKLPVLTKKDIRENWQSLIPKNINKIRYLNDIKHQYKYDGWREDRIIEVIDFKDEGANI